MNADSKTTILDDVDFDKTRRADIRAALKEIRRDIKCQPALLHPQRIVNLAAKVLQLDQACRTFALGVITEALARMEPKNDTHRRAGEQILESLFSARPELRVAKSFVCKGISNFQLIEIPEVMQTRMNFVAFSDVTTKRLSQPLKIVM